MSIHLRQYTDAVLAVLFVSLDDECFRYGDSITDVIDLLADATCVVTLKSHGAIVSFVYDVPVFLFCYEQKCPEFLRDNNLLGLHEPMPSAQACIATVTR